MIHRVLCVLAATVGLLAASCGGSAPSPEAPAGPPPGTGSPPTREAAFDLLLQTTFGPIEAEIENVQTAGIAGWVDWQLGLPSAYSTRGDSDMTYLERFIEVAQLIDPGHWPESIQAYTAPRTAPDDDVAVFAKGPALFDEVWFEAVLGRRDQLRQRVAHALSQILVVDGSHQGATTFYDILAEHAFGNYRELLIAVSRSSEMCYKLTFGGSKGGDPKYHPDENYARELMQLFTIGLHQLNLDGTPRRDGVGNLIPTYTPDDIEAIARVFTGWDRYGNPKYGSYFGPTTDTTRPTRFTSRYHDFGEKEILLEGQGTVIPAEQDPEAEIAAVIDMLFAHPNIAPFVSRHLIMRLVKSNPSPQYVARVATVFNDDGRGIRGNLKAIVRTILLDPEARTRGATAKKAKEPLLAFTQFLRSFGVDYAPTPFNALKLGGKNGVAVRNVYVFRTDFQDGFGQGPLTSPTVFNFYEPDFVPNDTAFRATGMVSPELQIQSEQAVTFFSNLCFKALDDYVLEDHTTASGANPRDWYSLSFSTEEAVLLQALDGDYANLADTSSVRRAAEALMEHLALKLTNDLLTGDQRRIITDFAANGAYGDGDVVAARALIGRMARLIIATDAYMVQR